MLIKRIKKRMLARRQYKQHMKQQHMMAQTGLLFSEELMVSDTTFPFGKFFLNALALFASVYGTLNCLITSFHLEIYSTVFFCVCLLLALYTCVMYINQIIKIIFYFLYLIISIFVATRYFWVINSGMNAVRNQCLKKIDAVFDLFKLREYTEYYNNEKVSITFAFCVMAMIMMILLNIIISEYMNVWLLVCITAPIISFGLYFSFVPSKFSMFLVMGSWFLVGGIRGTGEYFGNEYKMQSVYMESKNNHFYGFKTDAHNIVRISCYILLFVFAFVAVLVFAIPQQYFAMKTPFAQTRKITDEYVNKGLSYGISSFLFQDRTASQPGQIANTRGISFDGQTDLTVTLANNLNRRIYLREFAGIQYLPYQYRWNGNKGVLKHSDNVINNLNYTPNIVKYDFEHQQQFTKYLRGVEVSVKDDALKQNGRYLCYLPYYTLLNDQKQPENQTETKDFKYNNDATVYTAKETQYYSCYFQDVDISKANPLDIFYKNGKKLEDADLYLKDMNKQYQNAQDDYLRVPTENDEAIEWFCQKYNIRSTDENVVDEVVEALAKDYSYTLKPGKVPNSEEYVNYFLMSNKKGYCVHFATAATLLLRHLGIPARYVEGYVVDPENFQEGKATKESINTWMTGKKKYSDAVTSGTISEKEEIKKTKQEEELQDVEVESIDITDANGHAWVEIYEYGFGWMPLEVTNSASEDEGGFFDFDLPKFGVNDINDATQDVFSRINESNVEKTSFYMKRLFAGIVIILVFCYFGRMIFIVRKRRKRYKNPVMKERISARYQDFLMVLSLKCEETVYCLSYEQISAILCSMLDSENMLDFYKLQHMIFSGEELTIEQVEDMFAQLQQVQKQLVKTLRLGQKINYYCIAVMW